MDRIVRAIDEFAIVHAGKSPESLTILTEPDEWGEILLAEVPLDPWGRPYVYELKSQYEPWSLLTFGKDGRPGGIGEDSDIVWPWPQN